MHRKSKTSFMHFCNSRVEPDESPSSARLHDGGRRPSLRSPRSRCFERIRLTSFRISMVFLAVGIWLAATPSARATSYAETLLHSFTSSGGDGTNPTTAALIIDSNGNLYGTTPQGGTSGNGTVFELVNSSGTYSEKVLYSFTGGADGGLPSGGLVIDASGNLYGITRFGGANNLNLGTVFELVNSSGTYSEKVLYSFTGGAAGSGPIGPLVIDASGNLYGTSLANTSVYQFDYGKVFELVNSSGVYSEKVLYSFTGGADGSGPNGGLLIDASGNLYGTTGRGGSSGSGTVFELVNSSGTYSEKVLYSFTGAGPSAGVIMDASGNLYGTTESGGSSNRGTVFELVNSSGTYSETVLYSFTGVADGSAPFAGVIMDASGNLYGTTFYGGNQSVGTVFELVHSSGTYTEKVLHSFASCATDGRNPTAALLMDASGNLYGTTNAGGSSLNYGTVFEVIPFTGQAATTTTVLTSSLNPANAGDTVTLTATVTPSSNNFVLTGTLTISSGSLVLSSAPLGCGATQLAYEDASSLGIGLNTLTATFTPDTAAFAASSGTVQQTVNEPGAVVTTGNNTLTGNQTINGTVSATSLVGGLLAVGGGTPIQEYTTVTDAVTLPSLIPFSCTEFTTAAVTGFTPGTSDTIALGTPSSLLTGLGNGVFLFYQAWETTTTTSPTITIQVCNPGARWYAGGASGTIRVSIFKH